MPWKANSEFPKPRRYEINHDQSVGFYLYVFEGDKCIRDHFQDTLEMAMECALEEHGVPKNAWKKECKMKFLIQKPRDDQNFALVYRPEDYSFDIEPLDGSGDTSIMVNELQLEIDYEGKIMYVWGFCPLIKYEETNAVPQGYTIHSLVAVLDKPLIPGISYRLNEQSRWPIYINKKKGWVCLGNPITKDKQLIEFAPDCVATLENQEIIAVWLRPKSLPDLA